LLVVAVGIAGSLLVWRELRSAAVASGDWSPLPQALLAGGILVSLLFGLAVRFAQKADRRFRALAAERRRMERAEAELTRARDHYLLQLERFPAMIWRTGANAWRDYHNQTWLDFTGRAFEEEQGTGWAENVHPDDRDSLQRSFMATFEARGPFEMEYRVRHHSGEYRRVSDHARPIFDLDGRFAGYIGACFDVSQNEKAHAALRESEEIFRSIVQTASVGVARTDPEGRFVLTNAAYQKMLGYSAEELNRLSLADVTHPDDWPRNRELFEGLIRREIPSFDIEKRYRRKDGNDIWAHSSVSAVFDATGHPLFVHAISQDITEQKRIHEELEKRQILLREAQDLAGMGSWEWDLRSGLVEWADTEFRLFGLVPGSIDLTYANFLALVHPEDHALVMEDVQRTMETGESETIFRIFRSDGSVRWIQSRRRLMRGEKGEPVRMIGTSYDITDMKQAEQALRDSRTQLAVAQEIAHVGNWQWNIETDEVHWSDELYRIYGFEPGEIDLDYGAFLSCVYPDDRERVDRIVREAFASGEPFDYLHNIVRPDGVVRTIHARGRVERDAAGRAIRMLGTGEDVTERIQAEREIRRSGDRYRMLAENVQEMIIRFTPEGTITYASTAVRKVLGYEPEEVVGKGGQEFLHPDDLEQVVEAHRDMLRGIEPPAVLSRLLHRDGHPVWTETTTRAVRDPDTGMVEAIVAVSRDVTESVRAARSSRLLHAVTVAANEADSAREALQSALGLVCEHFGWPVGHAYVPSRSTQAKHGSLDIWHLDDPARHARLRQVIDTTVLPDGMGLLGRVLDSGKTEWVQDVTQDPRFLRVTMARHLGVRSAFMFPVRSGESTIAVLEFFAERREAPDQSVIDLLENVVSQLGEVLRRKQAEQALRASEERFRAVAESANDAILTIDEEGIVIFCNQSLQRIFGYTFDEVCGKSISRLLPDRDGKGQPSGFRHFLENGDHLVGSMIEVCGRRKDGEEFPIELSLAAWETEEGSFVTGILRDVSARKQVEEVLEEKMKELARSNAELGLFTYVASHDLREPLRTVGSNVQLLARNLTDRRDAETSRQIDFAMGGVRRMQALIDDLLAYSRVGTEGRVFEDFDSRDAVREAVQALAVAIEETDGIVSIDPLPRVRADRSQLVQLFQNLLSNAIKFHGEESPRVDVGAEREGDAWVFTVRDRGIGIDPRYAEYVFTIFQRLHSHEEYPGTGIGLAVCRKIVERHGGRIWVESEPGKGSAFRFTIPARGA
jgi:PAS domain S-box-containing protein